MVIYPWVHGDTTEWLMIGTTVNTGYLDYRSDLWIYGNMINEYYVIAIYDEGQSPPSNVAGATFYEGINESLTKNIKIYPNPATDFLNIELQTRVEKTKVYNSSGILVAELSMQGKLSARLNVSGFSKGIYNLRFTNAKGESFSSKFVKM